MSKYADIPGALEWVLTAATKEQDNRHALDRGNAARLDHALQAQIGIARRGQVLGFAASLVAFAASSYAIHCDMPTAAAILGTTGVGLVLAAFVEGKRRAPPQPSQPVTPSSEPPPPHGGHP